VFSLKVKKITIR